MYHINKNLSQGEYCLSIFRYFISREKEIYHYLHNHMEYSDVRNIKSLIINKLIESFIHIKVFLITLNKGCFL